MSARSKDAATVSRACLLAGLAFCALPTDPSRAQAIDMGAGWTPGHLAPAFDNYVELGAGYASEGSFRFGKYTGLTDAGIEPLFGFMLGAGDAADASVYWQVAGSRLGQAGRGLALRAGRRGLDELEIAYRETPRYRVEDARTPFRGDGSGVFTLPPDWAVTGSTTADMPRLAESLSTMDIETRRRRFAVAYERRLPENWTLEVDYRREYKEGNTSFGAVVGTNGGNPRAALLPAPVDYVYDIVDVTLGYVGEGFQLGLGYYGSFFDNESGTLTWENPFGQVGNWAPGVGYPDGLGRVALEPDNAFNQLRFTGQYRFTPATVLTGTVAYGRMAQDEAFLAYTVNRNLDAPKPLPRDSLDGEIDTTLVDLKLTGRPTGRLHLSAGYRFDDRENETPRETYLMVHGDAGHQDPPGQGRINLPYSYTEEELSLDGSYRLPGGVRMEAGFRHGWQDRDFSEVDRSDTRALELGVSARPADTASFSLDLSREERDVDVYLANLPYRLSHEPGATDADGFENHPLLRRFNLADRERDRAGLRADWFPAARLSLGLSSSFSHDDYGDSHFGLNDADVRSHSLDLGYVPADDMAFTAFFTRERVDSDMRGRSWPGFAPQLAFDPDQNWFMSADDRIDTVGLSAALDDIGRRLGLEQRADGSGRLDLELEWLYSRSRSQIDVTGAPNIETAPLPELRTRLSSYGVHGRYRVTGSLALRFGLQHEEYATRDFALDGVAPDTLANVLGLGEASPDYDVTWVTLSFVYGF